MNCGRVDRCVERALTRCWPCVERASIVIAAAAAAQTAAGAARPATSAAAASALALANLAATATAATVLVRQRRWQQSQRLWQPWQRPSVCSSGQGDSSDRSDGDGGVGRAKHISNHHGHRDLFDTHGGNGLGICGAGACGNETPAIVAAIATRTASKTANAWIIGATKLLVKHL